MRKLLDFIIRLVIVPFSVVLIFGLFLSYKSKGKISFLEYRIFRKLYFVSGGLSSLILEKLLGIKSKDYVLEESKILHQNGYLVFENFLTELDTNKISDFVREHASIPKGATRKDVPESVLAKSAQLSELFFNNERIKSISTDYLGSECKLDLMAAWRSFPLTLTAKDDVNLAAQMWHADLDTVKWLKAFVYLSDVDEKGGPHCFCPGTHRLLPLGIIRDGRYSDAFLDKLGVQKKMLIGKKGTLILADTRALHKGLEVLEGERRIIQLQYSASTFGKLSGYYD